MKNTFRGIFSAHSCSSNCVEEFPFAEAKVHGSPPLQIPILHCGWSRTRVKHSQGGRRRITYTAPCGRKLRDLSEVGNLFFKMTLSVRIDTESLKCEPKGLGSLKGLVKLRTSCLFLVLLGIQLGSKADQNPPAP